MAVTLVLNATYEPLCIVPLRRAVVLVLAGKADIVEVRAGYLHSERLAIPSPDVVRLSRYVRIPYRGGAALTRRAVLDRDEHRCAYCQARADTVDHVVPRSRGGRHEWTNVVAACSRCNHRKGNRLLSEIGWALRVPAVQPPAALTLIHGAARRGGGSGANGSGESNWAQYLQYISHRSSGAVETDTYAEPIAG